MLVGIGVDIVDTARFARVLQRTPRLRDRLFTPAERDLGSASLAARFAAKEALAKALGAPRGLRWQDVQIVCDTVGRPSLVVTGTVASAAAAVGVRRWHVSLSHDGGTAIAMVVAEA